MTRYCVDDKHDSPCPEPCVACADEGCDPHHVSASEAAKLFPGWQPGMTSEDMQRAATIVSEFETYMGNDA